LESDESDFQPIHTIAEVESAVQINPWKSVNVLAAHLGIDLDAIHDGVTQLEFQQKTNVAVKQLPSGSTRHPPTNQITGGCALRCNYKIILFFRRRGTEVGIFGRG
jgi:hypothetical protein